MVENRGYRLKGARSETWDEGAFTEILSRLPVKSICSFKSVCKSWNGLMSSNFFTKKQFRLSRENPSLVSCPSMDTRMKLYSINPKSLKLVSLNTINPAERSQENYMYVISSFNGLICCINHISDEDVEEQFWDLQIWICNPCTGETLLLPQGRPSFGVEPSVGVAYASDISDYRVFRIFCAGKKIPEEKVSTRIHYEEGRIFINDIYDLAYECEVYSSRTGSWENIGPVPRGPMRACISPFRSSHVFVGGKIFWLVSLGGPGEIMSVDMEGRFKVFSLPPYPKYLNDEDKITEGTYLINLEGSVSLVILHPRYMDVWVWQKVCEEFKWVEIDCRKRVPFKDEDLVLGMTSVKNHIICMTTTHWWSFTLPYGKWKKKLARPSRFVNPSVFPFTQSFLSCNGGEML